VRCQLVRSRSGYSAHTCICSDQCLNHGRRRMRARKGKIGVQAPALAPCSCPRRPWLSSCPATTTWSCGAPPPKPCVPSKVSGHGFDVLFAVVGPHDPARDGHRLVEGVLRDAGPGRVEDRLAAGRLPRRRRLDVLHPPSVEQMFAWWKGIACRFGEYGAGPRHP
jgi:hypothetical protein